jgi:type IV secretion system protein VirB11
VTQVARQSGLFYLGAWLEPLAPFLARADVTDIFVNRPEEIWVESLGGAIERHDVPALKHVTIERLVRQIAAWSHQGVSREHPLLAATLPDGSRVQVAMPPATRGEIAIAIRRHVSADMTLDEFADEGLFPEASTAPVPPPAQQTWNALRSAKMNAFLREAVRNRANILVSGGTATGKTTFLNALLREVPGDERLILIEDASELKVQRPNLVGLIAARSALREADVSAEDLLIAALRMRPDRIILGEIRGGEAMTFLRAINTGHPGSLATIHADSPERAVEQLAMLVLQTGTRLRWEDVVRYVRSTIDIYVHLDRRAGVRGVAAIITRDELTSLSE